MIKYYLWICWGCWVVRECSDVIIQNKKRALCDDCFKKLYLPLEDMK